MEQIKILAKNKKAQHNYFILRKIECGIELFGTEVKSIRLGKVNISESYASIDGGEVFIKAMNISPYEQGNIFNRDPLRPKKLLLHKNEIRTLIGETTQDGCTLIPLSVYLKGSRVKVELGVCKGKKLYDKRNDLKEKSAKRDIDRALRDKNKQI
ncbi:MAG: SsrA-binding protein SmpB [Clostridia bacterium]|nr:SsrA-binding protein SmpB [Clostridia bacterium]